MKNRIVELRGQVGASSKERLRSALCARTVQRQSDLRAERHQHAAKHGETDHKHSTLGYVSKAWEMK